MYIIKFWSLFFPDRPLIEDFSADHIPLELENIHRLEREKPPVSRRPLEHYPPENMELPVPMAVLNVSDKEVFESRATLEDENHNGKEMAGLIRCHRKRRSRDQLLPGMKKLALTESENVHQHLQSASFITQKVPILGLCSQNLLLILESNSKKSARKEEL
jgi:hypothetical protein